MSLDSAFHTLTLIVQVFLLDLVLSGDNAVIIALVCRRLPPQQVRRAMLIGVGAGVALRVLLAGLVGVLLWLPLFKLVGALMLLVIAIQLLVSEEDAGYGQLQAASSLQAAVVAVIGADLVMSMDNVAALAAVAQGNIAVLALGVLFSVPLLMYGSRIMAVLLQRYPLLVPASGALLGYLAGEIGVGDALVAEWVDTQSPGLHVVVPLLCAAYVVLQSRIIEQRRRILPKPAALQREVPSAEVASPSQGPVPVALPPTAIDVQHAAASMGEGGAMAALVSADAGARTVSLPALAASGTQDIAVSVAPAPAPAPSGTTSALAVLSRFGPLVLGLLVLTAFVVAIFLIAGSRHPAPAGTGASAAAAPRVGYVCPGGDVTVYYQHDASSILLMLAEGEVMVGKVDTTNHITWSPPAAGMASLHFALPDKVESDAHSVRLTGGSSVDWRCVRKK